MDVTRMTNKEAKTVLVNLTYFFENEEIREALDVAISALSVIEQTKWERDTALATLEEHGIGLGQRAEPSDLISRAELIKHFKTFNEKYLTLDTICDEVQSAPSVSAERVGVWIWKTEDKYKCSECEHETHVDECMQEPIYEYCPYCGARMGVE